MHSMKICRFSPNGPEDVGMQIWDPIDPSELETGKPVQRGHVYHEDTAHGYMAGVWDCTPMTVKFAPYPVNEFMFLLEGSVTMRLSDGSEVTINAGETFIIPKSLPCQWKQEGYVRKFFAIFENPGIPATQNILDHKLILPQPSGPVGGMQQLKIQDAEGFLGSVPIQQKHVYFSDSTDQFSVGVTYSAPFETVSKPAAKSEMMILLQGTAIITDDYGSEFNVNAGDTIYIPKGAAYRWKSTEYVRQIYCCFDPA